MPLTTRTLANYLHQYVAEYRRAYQRLTASSPEGAGYPPLDVSPYLGTATLTCILSRDGVSILDCSREPGNAWYIAGGPALMVDTPNTQTPPEVVDVLKANDLFGKPIGIYRLVAKTDIPNVVWRGDMGPQCDEIVTHGETPVRVARVDLSQRQVLERLTFGAIGHVLPAHLGLKTDDFWNPQIIRKLGFLTADRKYRRFVNYLELSPHTETAAWDPRSIRTRVQMDIRRDFAHTVAMFEQDEGSVGGSISYGGPYFDRLSRLSNMIERFSKLLETRGDADESVFHDFIEKNPLILDVYARAVSKPRLEYPESSSPLGKKYVEPDFILCYSGQTYKLVELERPNKLIATAKGQPRAELTQAVFQIGEWKAYIAKHYDRIKDRFPGISTGHVAVVIISRTSALAFGDGRDVLKYKELLRSTYGSIDVWTYDDVLERAREAYVQLASLGIGPQKNVV